MTTDRAKLAGGGSPRQKIIGGVVIVVFAFLGWQIYGMFGGGGSGSPAPATTGAAMVPTTPSPQPATLIQPSAAPVTEREAALMKLQEETQAKYLAAVNELQMLKVEKEIAETNKAIVTAKLDTVTAQKNMVDILQPPKPETTVADYAQGLANGGTVAAATPNATPAQAAPASDSYTVISVSHLDGRWNAVIGYQGKLMNVFEGDVLPADGSTVVSINKGGVTLKLKDGSTKKVSLVSII